MGSDCIAVLGICSSSSSPRRALGKIADLCLARAPGKKNGNLSMTCNSHDLYAALECYPENVLILGDEALYSTRKHAARTNINALG
jgi:hypothetical protein